MWRLFVLFFLLLAFAGICAYAAHIFLTSMKAKKQLADKREEIGSDLWDICARVEAARERQQRLAQNLQKAGLPDCQSTVEDLTGISGMLGNIKEYAYAHPKQVGNLNDIEQHILPSLEKAIEEYELCLTAGPDSQQAKENLEIIAKILKEAREILQKRMDGLLKGRSYNLQVELEVMAALHNRTLDEFSKDK